MQDVTVHHSAANEDTDDDRPIRAVLPVSSLAFAAIGVLTLMPNPAPIASPLHALFDTLQTGSMVLLSMVGFLIAFLTYTMGFPPLRAALRGALMTVAAGLVLLGALALTGGRHPILVLAFVFVLLIPGTRALYACLDKPSRRWSP